ncbi:MAG: amidohydrolase, partial [Candidatus Omnitrophica bacterium]|nr:amidohydrolase [Candidatus Omnitrophota bacterium]
NGKCPSKEHFHKIAENVLMKFPKLKVIFAHFYFLSSDLERLGLLLETYPHLYLDIAPGTEMFINFSKHLDKTREFFIRYQDRILYARDYFDNRHQQLLNSFGLPRAVLEKIYFRNALKLVPEEKGLGKRKKR